MEGVAMTTPNNPITHNVPKTHTPANWCELTDTCILDPDGWRFGVRGFEEVEWSKPKSWEEPITIEEFLARASGSTQMIVRAAHPATGDVDMCPDCNRPMRWICDPTGNTDFYVCFSCENETGDAKPVEQRQELQPRVRPWLLACFGEVIADDAAERNHRFLEESLELVQACGCTQSEAHQLVDYVFSRPIGEKTQEAGGVMITLAALCLAQRIDMHECGEVELARIWTKVEAIRAKQAAKPKHSPLPQ